MNILVAPNALKGSLDPFRAADAMAEGLARAFPRARIEKLPIADGGDSTSAVLLAASKGEFVEACVLDPLGRLRKANFGLLAREREAVIEIAQASGLALLATPERDPLVATTFGTGELVKAALDRGCRRIVMALGGSATVDGGSGLLEALGVRLLDGAGKEVPRGGGGLDRLERIDVTGLDPRLAGAELLAICDVDNPLLGEHGASRTFGPQKGATSADVVRLEANLARFAAIIERDLGRDVRSMRHGGSAGGLGAGIAGVLGCRLEPGATYVLERLGTRERIAGQHLVLTAEGHLDSQTLQNKAPYALARLARAAGVPIVALAGGISDDVGGLSGAGTTGIRTEAFELFDAIVPICPRPMRLEEAMGRARTSLVEAAERVGRLLQIGARVPVAPGAT